MKSKKIGKIKDNEIIFPSHDSRLPFHENESVNIRVISVIRVLKDDLDII